ncbi:LacI family DNA-binding transcriptional regulator [Plantibacter sp. CFBP 13570]|uniref:LacI family DNA-binding transcriptional regulator n=1 Tax=Plantibacter sp. CFBP 13570 TaxID=2775272 RepID=UPI001930A145|nr:LacI family DNA-binding transcriptional regulator [Plantibacter sp. CFBP 13570]MBD8534656.1 LacI family DNA-binding transcriptional regulator [Plantibacter sp. CFBP 13570]
MDERPQKATIYAVAKRAGVSISTVSLAINHPQRVNEATRRSVIAAATELGYRGGAAASGAQRIAVAAPFSSYASYYRRLSGIMERAAMDSVEIVVHDLPSAAGSDSPVLDALPMRAGIDGIVVMGVPLSPAALESKALPGPPVVLVDVPDGAQRRLGLPSVLIDDERGGELIARHLSELGHERVVFLHEPQRSEEYVSAGMLRARGLGHLLSVSEAVADVAATDLVEAVGAALERAFRVDPEATAVVANHDELAAAAHRAFRVTGAHLPVGRSLVGYDDGPLASALDLTTVRQPFEESGYAALDLLLGRLSGEHARVSSVQLAPDLVVRGTTFRV